METFVREVRDLNNADRSVIERLVGHALGEDQKLLIQVMTTARSEVEAGAPDSLPDWSRVYEGLSEQEIAELEAVVTRRADLSRST
jgi:hypothetical protein